MSNLGDLTATEQVAAIRARELDPVELTEHYLDRIERHDKRLGTFITVTPELALEGARAAAGRVVRDDPDSLPPLLGLPLGIKDLSPTAGVTTTMGSAALRSFVPPIDSWTVGLLRSAGIALLGKTSAPEFGPTCYTDNDLVEPAVTPWDLERSASGSSGGAAAAVAAGLMPVAHGSDGAGSIRTPASTCGLVGVKPSRGVVSMYPSTGFFSASVEGPIARTVADAALLLDVMAATPPGELWPSPLPSDHRSFAAAAQQPVERSLRIASCVDTGMEGVEVDPEAVAAVAVTTRFLEDLGHEVVPIAHPAPWDDGTVAALKMKFAVSIALTVGVLIPEEQQHLLRPLSKMYRAEGLAASSADVAMADVLLAGMASRYLTGVAGFDAVLMPTTNGPAVPLGWFGQEDTDASRQAMLGWSCFTPHTNLTGMCGVSLPLHWTAEGLPVGSQLLARPGADGLLFGLAAQLERLVPWAARKPELWNA